MKILEEKLVKAEADMFKHSEQFKMATDKLAIENKILKESIKKSSEEIKTQKKNVSELSKVVKQREKESYNLQRSLENWQDKTKGFKEVISKNKVEKDKLEKQNKKLLKTHQLKSNQNTKSSEILVSTEAQTYQSESSLTTNSMATPIIIANPTNNNLDPVLPQLKRSPSPRPFSTSPPTSTALRTPASSPASTPPR